MQSVGLLYNVYLCLLHGFTLISKKWTCSINTNSPDLTTVIRTGISIYKQYSHKSQYQRSDDLAAATLALTIAVVKQIPPC